MRTQWTTKGNQDAGSSCLCDRGLHRYLRNFGGGVWTPQTPPSVRHCTVYATARYHEHKIQIWCLKSTGKKLCDTCPCSASGNFSLCCLPLEPWSCVFDTENGRSLSMSADCQVLCEWITTRCSRREAYSSDFDWYTVPVCLTGYASCVCVRNTALCASVRAQTAFVLTETLKAAAFYIVDAAKLFFV